MPKAVLGITSRRCGLDREPEIVVRDWAGFELNNLAKAAAPEMLDDALADLRRWMDAVSSVTKPAGGLTNRRFLLKSANDLLAVPPDRRDACLQQLREAILALKAMNERPDAHFRKSLVADGFPSLLAWLTTKVVGRISVHDIGHVWRDDGVFTSADQILAASGRSGYMLASASETDRSVQGRAAAPMPPR